MHIRYRNDVVVDRPCLVEGTHALIQKVQTWDKKVVNGWESIPLNLGLRESVRARVGWCDSTLPRDPIPVHSALFRVLKVGSQYLDPDVHQYVRHDATPSRLMDLIDRIAKSAPILACRLLRLKAGCFVNFHRDVETAPPFKRIHIPVHTNESCLMIYSELEPGTVHDMIGRPTSAISMLDAIRNSNVAITIHHIPTATVAETDIHHTHAVLNAGDRDRIHLVVDLGMSKDEPD